MMSPLFAMGYARFVWSAYGLAAVSLFGVLWLSWRAHKRVLRQLKQTRVGLHESTT